MEKLHISAVINASPEKVWEAIVTDEKYRYWTSAFMEGSYFKGGWNKGDSIQFLMTDDEGKTGGMISEIAESRFPEYISIKHLGMIRDGVIDTESDEAKNWAIAYENYTLTRLSDGSTEFKLDQDMEDKYHDMFTDMWGKAMVKLKEISERES